MIFIHWHPPYWTMKADEYLSLNSDVNNLANFKNWDIFTLMLKRAFLKLWDEALKKNGIIVVLCGLIRKNGRMYDMALELIDLKKECFQYEIIKVQQGIELSKK